MIGIGNPIQILHPSHADSVSDRAQYPNKQFVTVICITKPIKMLCQSHADHVLDRTHYPNNKFFPMIGELWRPKA